MCLHAPRDRELTLCQGRPCQLCLAQVVPILPDTELLPLGAPAVLQQIIPGLRLAHSPPGSLPALRVLTSGSFRARQTWLANRGARPSHLLFWVL